MPAAGFYCESVQEKTLAAGFHLCNAIMKENTKDTRSVLCQHTGEGIGGILSASCQHTGESIEGMLSTKCQRSGKSIGGMYFAFYQSMGKNTIGEIPEFADGIFSDKGIAFIGLLPGVRMKAAGRTGE